MKITIHPVVLLRIPAFSINDQLAEVWEELKLAIRFSSSSFYEKIKDIEAHELASLDFKVQFTIWKYFNRSRYRGTPYGSFAGFAVAELMDQTTEVVFSASQHLHCFKDWSHRNDLQVSDEELTSPDRFYFSNSSTYSTSRNIRFIALQDQVFELAEIEKSAFITGLLEYCSKKAKYKELLAFSADKEVAESVLTGILKAMLDLQLLFTDLHPNIIGPDYFNRTTQPLSETEEQYLIAERKVLSGGVNKAALKHLPACIDYLIKNATTTEHQGLKSFKQAFQKRFDVQELPLMTVLDPELGIGYGDLVRSDREDLANELSEKTNPSDVAGTHPGEFTRLLLKEMLRTASDKAAVIRLESFDDKQLIKNEIRPANSFSTLARFAGDLVVLEQIGGCTANALAGRFTLGSEAVTSHCRGIAAAESAANPDVIFFDLAYMAEGKVDNINRRKQIYTHEVPILNYSCCDQVIPLNDLMVTVKNGEIILFSAHYGRRVVPRLASAYNYSRSDLAVYRFLCDLQHQQIQSQVSFDIQSRLPGLDFYPRVQYKNLVLSTAKWRIRSADSHRKPIADLLNEMGVPRYFSAGSGDQTLCFDKENETDLLCFKHYLNQYNDFVITEVIIDDCQAFKDTNMKNYFTQILITLNHNEQLYRNHIPQKNNSNKPIQRVIVPGKDWLYFEIYCHQERADVLLAGTLAEFIKRYSSKFKTWFFIRYNDPAPHLRLRLQLSDASDGYLYISQLMEMLSEDLSDGIISDIQLKTYQRETERYGLKQIELTEGHFKVDSEYALTWIKSDATPSDKYAGCVALMKAILSKLEPDPKARQLFIREIQRFFEKEHHMESAEFKKVNREWSLFAAEYPGSRLDHMARQLPVDLLGSFLDTLAESSDENRKSLFCSLFHMHINRLFASSQRAHETIIYSFLYKQLQSEKQNLRVMKLDY